MRVPLRTVASKVRTDNLLRAFAFLSGGITIASIAVVPGSSGPVEGKVLLASMGLLMASIGAFFLPVVLRTPTELEFSKDEMRVRYGKRSVRLPARELGLIKTRSSKFSETDAVVVSTRDGSTLTLESLHDPIIRRVLEWGRGAGADVEERPQEKPKEAKSSPWAMTVLPEGQVREDLAVAWFFKVSRLPVGRWCTADPSRLISVMRWFPVVMPIGSTVAAGALAFLITHSWTSAFGAALATQIAGAFLTYQVMTPERTGQIGISHYRIGEGTVVAGPSEERLRRGAQARGMELRSEWRSGDGWSLKFRPGVSVVYAPRTDQQGAHFTVRSRGRPRLEAHQKIKGILLEALGTGPATIRPLPAVDGASRQRPLLTGRADQPKPGERPPPWAFADPGGAAKPVPDGRRAVKDFRAAPAGWWVSSWRIAREEQEYQWGLRLAIVGAAPMAGLFLGWMVVRDLGIAVVLASIFSSSVGGTGLLMVFMARWAVPRWNETRAHSALRIQAGPVPIGRVAAVVGSALEPWGTKPVAVMPGSGIVFAWRDGEERLAVALHQDEHEASEAVLDLDSTRPPEDVLQIKGAVLKALYGRPAMGADPTAAAPPPSAGASPSRPRPP